MEEKSGRNKIWNWQFLAGLTGLVAAILLMVDGFDAIAEVFGGVEGLGFFVIAAALAALGSCVIIALTGALSEMMWLPSYTIICFLGLVGLLAGFAVAILFPSSSPLLMFSGVLFGVGFCFLTVKWAVLIANLSARDLARYLSVGFFFSGIYKLAASFVYSPATVAGFLALAVAVATTGAFLKSSEREEAQPESEDDRIVAIKALLGRNWILMTGFFLLVYVIACTWSAYLGGQAISNNPEAEGVCGAAVGSTLAAVVLLIIGRTKQEAVSRMAMKVMPLICITSLLLVWFLGSWATEVGRFFSNIPLGFSIAAFSQLLCYRMGREVRENLSALLIFGLYGMAVLAFLIIVAALWPFLGDYFASVIHLSLMVVYLMAAAIITMVYSERKSEAKQSSLPDLSDTYLAVSEKYGLSTRETETLALLVQGRSAPYIAKEHYVSVNTVKTHMKRIYQKMGIHSREELLDLLYRDHED